MSLSATASTGNSINWYANATGGAPLASNTSTFTTPVITNTTTYYAAAGSGSQTQTSAMPTTAPNVSTTTVGGLVIDVTLPLVLNSVNVFSINGGNVSVELRNSAGSLVAGPTVFPLIASTYTNPQNLQLNWAIPPGNGYRLLATPSAALGYQGGNYPIALGNNAGNIVNGAVSTTGTSTLNYYFYNLQTTIGCEGTRVPVTATVTTPPAYTLTATPPTICTAGSSTISISSANNYTYSWTPTGSGSSFTVSPTTTTKYIVSGIDGNNCGILDSITLNVVSPPSALTATASPGSVCVAGSTSLSLTPTPMAGLTIQWEKNTGSGYTTIAGATNANYTEPVTATAAYRALVYCNSNLVATSTVDTVMYSNPVVAQTFPGSRCGTGPVTLAALGANGATIRWYANATGGSVLGTGNAFTTPSITTTTNYFAAPVSGGGGALNDTALTRPLGTSTCCINFHMFLVEAKSQDVIIEKFLVRATDAINTATSWNVYYRPNNYQLVPGANTSNAGWTLLFNATNIPSQGTNAYTLLQNNVNLTIPANATYSFHIAPVTGTLGYSTQTAGTITDSNADLRYKAGHRGGAAFNCTTGGGMPYISLVYKGASCEGTRVPVTATINPGASGTGLATGGTT
ncbi:MAG TPA: hypothetical protein PL084_13335, partial [Chitinophagales bacterium]|nr:hypothetical protein [Chitinophagales bacterium]